jgi:BirA family biotin operon repressor/biotin-[acetyl-CoA-carboxylase] ligase
MSAAAADLSAPFRLVHLPEVDSTNLEAMRRALAGEEGPLWVLADRQTAGRGRSRRAWASEPGNLFASLLVTTACPPAKAGQLSLVAGVAAIEAIRKAGALAAGAHLRLKWPNDILIGPGKTGGILVESSRRGSEAGMLAVIGVGLNLASAPAELGRGATYLAQHGLPLSPREALCFLAGAMDAWLKTWDDGQGFALIREAWLARAGAVGEPLTVHASEGPIEGRFVGLDAEGALVIAGPDGRERRFTFGDVTLANMPRDADAQEEDKSR